MDHHHDDSDKSMLEKIKDQFTGASSTNQDDTSDYEKEGSDKSMIEKIKDQFKGSSDDKKDKKPKSEIKCQGEPVEFFTKPAGYGSHSTYVATKKGGLKDQEPVRMDYGGHTKTPTVHFQSDVNKTTATTLTPGLGTTPQGEDSYARNLGQTLVEPSRVPAKQHIYGYGANP